MKVIRDKVGGGGSPRTEEVKRWAPPTVIDSLSCDLVRVEMECSPAGTTWRVWVLGLLHGWLRFDADDPAGDRWARETAERGREVVTRRLTELGYVRR